MLMANDADPSWVHEGQDTEEKTALMGSGEVALQDSNSKHAEEAKQDYGAVAVDDEEEEKEVEKKKTEPEWHDDEAAPAARKKKKKGKTIKKSIRVSESLHEVLINRPHRPFCLVVFIFIQAIAILASLSLLITQVLPLFYLEQGFRRIGLLQIALRVYMGCFCVVILLVEWDVRLPFVQNSALLQKWISRGFLYSFVGLTGMEMSYSLRIDDMVAHDADKFRISWMPLFMEISSWLMFVTGCIYMTMGLCCLKGLRKKLQDQYQHRIQEYRNRDVAVETTV